MTFSRLNFFRFLIVASFFMAACSNHLQVQSEPNKTSHEEFNFFVLGDWGQRGDANQTAVANAMKQQAQLWNPKFMVLTGDNFYLFGVKDTADSHWQESFEKVYEPLNKSLDWYVALGNHDYMGNPQAEIDYQQVNRHWVLPSRYYSKLVQLPNGQTLRLLFMDTSPFVKSYRKGITFTKGLQYQDTTAQLRWMDSTLANAKEDWKIVVGHHPLYSCDKHGDTKELQSNVQALFEKYKVHAYICGHSHNLQHHHLANYFTEHFISGAGAEAIKVKPKENTAFAKQALGFANMSFQNDSLITRFFDVNGSIIYRFAKARK
jgi:tartrate-resistant acid phosphatase type 5